MILSIIRDRLKVDVRKEDIEAVHRLGRKQQKDMRGHSQVRVPESARFRHPST